MRRTAEPDRLRTLIDVLVESVERPGDGSAIAGRAFMSRFHFDRLVGAALRESPGAFRRRLLLERAAYRLALDRDSVTEAAFDAGYGSLEAFTRAFRRGFGLAPSAFRSDGRRDFRLEAPNGVHFHPPGGLLLPGSDERGTTMDLTDRMVEHDLWLSRHLLDAAASLPAASLDEPVTVEPPTQAFPEDAPTVRSMLSKLVSTKEMWTAAIEGRAFREDDDITLDGLRRRLDDAGAEFAEIVRGIRERGDWDTAFIDATCDPPESFTYGGAVAHVLTWNAHRRNVIVGALAARGAGVDGVDPIGWERGL